MHKRACYKSTHHSRVPPPPPTACRRSHPRVRLEPLLLHQMLLEEPRELLAAGVGPQGLLGVGAAGRQVMARERQLLEGPRMKERMMQLQD